MTHGSDLTGCHFSPGTRSSRDISLSKNISGIPEPAISRTLSSGGSFIVSRLPLRRKPVSRTRAERLETRISREQKALLQRAAELQGRTLTDFVVTNLQQAAVRAIEEAQIIRLSPEDSRAFAEALLNPHSPSPKLRSAARRYLKRTGK